MGILGEANRLYATLSKNRAKSLVRWNHFWSTLRSGKLESAKEIFPPVAPNGANHTLSLFGQEYWQARMLEQQGSFNEAQKLLNQLATKDRSGYYGILAASRRVNRNVFHSPDRFQAKSINTTEIIPTQVSAVQDIYSQDTRRLIVPEDLAKFGLTGMARHVIADVMKRPARRLFAEERSLDLASNLGVYKFARWAHQNPRASGSSFPNARLTQITWSPDQTQKRVFPYAFSAEVDSVAARTDVDKYLILAIMKAESLFEPTARSPVGAIGLMQLMPYTAYAVARETGDEDFDLSTMTDQRRNIAYGGHYLGRLLKYYRGNVFLVAAAYNAGPQIVDRWIRRCGQCSLDAFVEEIPYMETRSYVKKVLENYHNYHQIYESQFKIFDPVASPIQPHKSDDIY
jgi:soluble lytic murein transglycosylase-like protein